MVFSAMRHPLEVVACLVSASPVPPTRHASGASKAGDADWEK
jgi:hypothetical protein